ncbi:MULTISPECIES: competence type IV pilus major pilin ComGC [unclassified Bacillus (in: firmicutes)]|uniref:competence type IV pilus major pilin ComGC n=1 Tax=unclassified Bacillus (in: firmicutes) TaxID=185979 RepID=UPI003D1DBD2A
MKNEKGFTLLEMLLVMLVISVLLLLIIPNVVKQRSSVQGKGCDAFVKSVEAQVQAYQLEYNKVPTVDELYNGKYITSKTCPKGESITIDATSGEVAVAGKS